MIRPDLHMHSTASDGRLSVYDLARQAARADVTMFAVTDHDTLAGLSDAADAAYERGLAFLPGVEISAECGAEVHVLGYGVRADDPVLNARFRLMAQDRSDRIDAMAEKLKDMGMPLPMDEIRAQAGASIGRPHLARGMIKMGYVVTVDEAFDRFLNRGRPAYVPRKKVSVAEAISLLKDRGAVPVLAHPALLKWSMERFLPLLDEWQAAGLRGIEVYHPANRGNYPMWDRLARQRGLMVTGGSDFHDFNDSHGLIGETAAEWPTACDDAWALYRACR